MKKFLWIFVMLVLDAEAAQKVYLDDKLKNSISVSSSQRSGINKVKRYNKALGLSERSSLHQRKSYHSKEGKSTTRYIQKYMNIPILGAEIILSKKKNSNNIKANGVAIYNIERDILDITTNITAAQALEKVKTIFSLKYKIINISKYSKETSVLKIWQDSRGNAKLIYDVSFMYLGEQPRYPHYYIDAKTGNTLFDYNRLMHIDAIGPGGNAKTGRYEYGSNGLSALDVTENNGICTMENAHVVTVDLEHTHNYEGTVEPFSFTCPENTYKEINGAYSPLNDAHFFGDITFEMYDRWFNISPLPTKLILQVHYGNGYENAFWDGERMTFGDGGNTFYPLIGLNIVSHEVAHGFTAQHSNLNYYGQSGGLNEAFSDIAGEAAEYFMLGTNDWKVGSDIMKDSEGLRSMNDPTSIGNSIDHASDYTNGLDVHYSSGVYNKAFYLLSSTSGWNTAKAFEVYVKANQEYWTSTSSWNNAGRGLLSATEDLGYSTNDVCISLNDVGVYPGTDSCPYVLPTPPTTIITLDSEQEGEWTTESSHSPQRNNSYTKYYQFTLNQRTDVRIDLESNTVDTYLSLLNEFGDIITYNDDGGLNENARIKTTLDAGTYIIDATTYRNNNTGTFTIKLNEIQLPTVMNINIGDKLYGEWSTSSGESPQRENHYSKYYTFSLIKATTINISLESEIDNVLYLLNDTGDIITYNHDSGVDSNAFISITLKAGTYTIDATTFRENKKGVYTIELKEKSTPSITLITLDGAVLQGTWRNQSAESAQRIGSYSHYYTFVLSEDTEVYIDLMSNTDNYLYLLNNAGEIMTFNDNNGVGKNAFISKSLKAGTYTIDATTYGRQATGDFMLSLMTKHMPISVPITASSTPIEGEWTRESAQSPNRHGSYSNYYTFTLNKRKMVKIELESSKDSYIYLIASNEYIIKSDNDGGNGNNAMLYKILNPGTYIVDATTNNHNEIGQFSLTVTTPTALELAKPIKLDKPEVVINGEWINASPLSFYSTFNKAEYYKFTLTTRTTVEIGLESSGDNYLVLRNSQGDLIDRNDDSGEGYNAFISPTLNPGTYVIEATGWRTGYIMKNFKLKIRDINYVSPYGWLPAVYHVILN